MALFAFLPPLEYPSGGLQKFHNYIPLIVEMLQIKNGNIKWLCRCQEVKNVKLWMHDAGRRSIAMVHLKKYL